MPLFSQKTPLVWANLWHHRVRTLVGIMGIAFAVILLFMQLGFLGSAEATASLIYDQLEFDLVMTSRDYVQISQTGSFARHRLAQVCAHKAVASASPLYLGAQFWRKEERLPYPGNRRPQNRRILIIAFQPGQEFGVAAVPASQLRAQPFWLGSCGVVVAGQFSLGAGFLADGLVLTSDQTYAQVMGSAALDHVNLGLIRLQPGADPVVVARDLNSTFGPEVYVWTRSAIEDREKRYWVEGTSIGIIFRSGVVVAVLVGVVFVYQVISSDIASRLKEFATLKAIGYDNSYLAQTVLYQSVLLALLGYVPGLLVAFGLYFLASAMAGITIGIPSEKASDLIARCLMVLVLTVGLCVVSGLFALGKLRAADPADLF
jgi:putative ABC transport system permease protein